MSGSDADNDTKQLKKALKKMELKLEKSQRQYNSLNRMLYNYEAFYQNSIQELKEQKRVLNEKNLELQSIRNELTHRYQELKDLHHQLERSASVDALTGVKNRKFFNTQLTQSVQLANEFRSNFCLLYIDLDGFKIVNDTHGHPVGDQVLIEISQRLQSTIRPEDTLARLGGDEFVIIIDRLDDTNSGTHKAQQLIEACREPLCVEGLTIHCISASIGVVFYSQQTQVPKESTTEIFLQQCADLALYQAKSLGKNQLSIYHAELSEAALVKNTLNESVAHALNQEHFFPFFQPIYDATTQQCVACESLARWPKERSSELLSPHHFLETIAQLNRLPDLDFLILRKVCEWVASKPIILEKLYYITVNFAPESLSLHDFWDRFERILARYQVPLSFIIIEITEHSFMGDDSQAIDSIHQLHCKGIRFALDDFGTGYSALSFLDQLPLALLKIDRHFTAGLPDRPFARSVFEYAMNLSRLLGFRVVAEGVENLSQYQYLMESGCHVLQGFYLSKPLAPDDLYSFLDQASHRKQLEKDY